MCKLLYILIFSQSCQRKWISIEICTEIFASVHTLTSILAFYVQTESLIILSTLSSLLLCRKHVTKVVTVRPLLLWASGSVSFTMKRVRTYFYHTFSSKLLCCSFSHHLTCLLSIIPSAALHVFSHDVKNQMEDYFTHSSSFQ